MTQSKVFQFIGLGVVAWFAFVIFIRTLGESVFTASNPLLLVLFVASIPALFGYVWMANKLTGVPLNEMNVPIVIMTTTALLIDGIAVGFTDIYGPTHEQVMAAASYILFGAGLGLLIGLWLEFRNQAVA